MMEEDDYLVLPIIDQDGREVGKYRVLPDDRTFIESFRDDTGNIWTPPSAWAYYRVCLSNEEKREDIARLTAALANIEAIAAANAYASDHVICYACASMLDHARAALGKVGS